MNYSTLPVSAADIRGELDDAKSKAKSIAGRGEAVIARAKSEARDLTQSEIRALDTLNEEFKTVEAKLLRLKDELAEAERKEDPLSQPLPRQASPGPINHVPPAPPPGYSFGNAAPSIAPIGARPTFNALFASARDPYNGAFKSLGEFCLTVAAGGHDARLLRNSSMTEATGTSGGFLVPMQFLSGILDGALAMETVRPRAMVVPMTSKTATVGAFDYSDGTSAARAGLTMAWVGEGSSLSEQTGKTREFNLTAKKGSIFVRVTNELASDALNFDRQLSEAMRAAVAIGLDTAFIAGNGAGQPLGILNSPCAISVAKEGSQANDTVNLTNVSKMAARLEPSSWRNSVWLCHPTVLPQLYSMTVAIRNVADTEFVGGSSAGVTQTADGGLAIYGRPVIITEACAPIGDVGDLILADLSKYVIGLRSDASIAIDSSKYFDSDELAFRLILRVDGQPMHAAARKLRDGSNTVSPFVTLAAR